jgi:hypothetical protein
MSIEAVRSDKVIQASKQLVIDSERALNLERIERDIRVIVESRTSKDLYKQALEPTKLLESVLKDLSCRSRLSELKANVFKQKLLLEKAYESVAGQITTVHGDWLRSLATNNPDRKHVVNKVARTLVVRIGELDCVAELLDIAIKDIDAAGYGLTNSTALMKLIYEGRGRVV